MLNFRFLSISFVLATFTLLLPRTSSAIQITEIMSRPQKEEALYEFIEIYNETSSKRDIGGWAFVKGLDFVFPTSTIMEPKSYLVIARNPKAIMSKYKIGNVVGPFTGTLKNSSDRIALTDLAGGLMIDVKYKSNGAWPVAPNGTGHSLAKISPRLNPQQPENWQTSLEMGGTPGKDNGFHLSKTSAKIVINEVFANTKGRQFIELYNPLAKPIDISGYWLSNAPDNLKLYRIPAKTVLPAKGYARCENVRFTLKTTGGKVLLTNPSGKMVLDAFAFDETPLKMSQGRYPDGLGDWYYMQPSPKSANSVNVNTDVVINEIMYHPPTDADGDEYIELYNRSKKRVDISGWRFSRGITFEFPKGTTIPARGYLVVAKDRKRLMSKYNLSSSLVVGNYMGILSNEGEKVRLRDNLSNKVDEVRYYDGGHWSKYADGLGSSLELIDLNHDNSNYQAWAPSDETKKAEWTHVSYSGKSYLGGYRGGSELHLHLLGAGEMLIDDISLVYSQSSARGTAGQEYRKGKDVLKDGSFETGLKNWVVVGNHVQSHAIDTDKKKGAKCLKIVATGCGDTGPNHIEQSIFTPVRGNAMCTISFWAKWQWGSNLLVTRCVNNRIPKTHRIPIPKLTGTPGKKNSVAKSNLGPVFKNTRHQPVIPKPSDTVHITTRVFDPDGVKSVTLFYKADAGRTYLKTEMYDDGKHNDVDVADGVYGCAIAPGQFNGQTIAFYIRAKDSKGNANTFPTNINRPCAYWVGSRRMTSKFPIYRLILTATDVRQLRRRPSLSNEPINCTFIFDEKDVYYNVNCRYTGSPFGRGGGGYRGYKVMFNADEKLHGVKRQARFDRNDGNYNERIAYRLQSQMRLPTCQQEWVYVLFNGRSEGVMEDILPPSKRYLEMFYPNDSDGQLFEVDDRFVFQGGYGRYGRRGGKHFTHIDATFQWLNTDNKDEYRWNYEVRNHEREDDYTHLIRMLKVMNKTPRANYESAIDEIINVDEWLRLMAARTVIADWDFFVATRGKNAYLYRPNDTGKWDILGWDSELTFQQTDMSIWSRFPAIRRFQRSPKHQHLYYSYIQELLDKYFTSTALMPWLKHYYSCIGRPHPYSMKAFIDSRSRYLRRIIPKATVSITTNAGKSISVKKDKIELAGTAPVQVRWVRVANKDYYLDWTNATNWKVTLPLQPGKNKLILDFLDYDKKPVGKDSIQVTAKP